MQTGTKNRLLRDTQSSKIFLGAFTGQRFRCQVVLRRNRYQQLQTKSLPTSKPEQHLDSLTHPPKLVNPRLVLVQRPAKAIGVGGTACVFVTFACAQPHIDWVFRGSGLSYPNWDVGDIGGHAQPPRRLLSRPRSRLYRLRLDLSWLSYRGLVWIPIDWAWQNLYHRGDGNNESNGRALMIDAQCVSHFLKCSGLHRIVSL